MSVSSKIRIGRPVLNNKKLQQVLLHILSKKFPLEKSFLHKFLYFIDFDYYERYEDSLIGATYLKWYGCPVAMELRLALKNMIEKDEVEIQKGFFQTNKTKYCAKCLPRCELSEKETVFIDEILERFHGKKHEEIAKYVEMDIPCCATPEGKQINYEAVFHRTAAYTARQD